MRLTWLPEVLRSAGLSVREYDGWKTRGRDDWGPIRGVICHATAGSRTSTAAGELRTIAITGSTSAPAPIAQLFLERAAPYTWWVVASGRCNHVKTGDKGPHKGYGNSALIGVEAQNDNRGEPWSPGMLDSYQRGVAAILRKLGKPASAAVAHREHQSGKSDPHGIDMASFRARVAALLAGEEDDMFSDDDRALLKNLSALGFNGGPSCGSVVAPSNGRPPSGSLVQKLDELLERTGGDPVPVQVDASAVASALAANTQFVNALAKAVNDDAAARMRD